MKAVFFLFTIVLAAALGAGASLWFVNQKSAGVGTMIAESKLDAAASAATENGRRFITSLETRQKGFCEAVAADRSFSAKLMVEADTSAPEITELARNYMGAMGFDVLTVSDVSGRILSCGAQPALAGQMPTAVPAAKAFEITADPSQPPGSDSLFIGRTQTFTSSGVPLTCIGGVVFNEKLMAQLSPSPDCPLIIMFGGRYYGTGTMKTISPVTPDGSIYINNEPWFARAVDPGFGKTIPGFKAWVVCRAGAPFSIRSIF